MKNHCMGKKILGGDIRSADISIDIYYIMFLNIFFGNPNNCLNKNFNI